MSSTPNAPPRSTVRRRPGKRSPAVDALGAILARLADVGDDVDEIDAEIASWATAMLRDGESASGGSSGTGAVAVDVAEQAAKVRPTIVRTG